ncbi:MAG TPA: sugar ABC transporter permease [Propionibacteriaceae bacterium]
MIRSTNAPDAPAAARQEQHGRTTTVEPLRQRAANWVERHLAVVFVGPSALILALMFAFPIGYTIYLSLHRWSGGVTAPQFKGIDNYTQLLFEDSRFHSALWRTFAFAGMAVLVETVLGVAIAMLLHRRFVLSGLVRSIFMLPMIATPVAVALVWKLMFQPDLGVLNAILKAIGIPAWGWTSNQAAALPLLALVDAWEWTSFMTLMTLAALAALPKWPLEAAAIDGANAWETFRHVVWPLIRPIVIAAAAFRAIDALKTFDLILVITGGGPGFASETIDVYAYRTTFEYQHLGYSAAMLIVFFLIVMTTTAGLLRLRRPAW